MITNASVIMIFLLSTPPILLIGLILFLLSFMDISNISSPHTPRSPLHPPTFSILGFLRFFFVVNRRVFFQRSLKPGGNLNCKRPYNIGL